MKSALVSIALALGAYLLGYNRGHDQGYDQAQKDTSEEVAEAHRVARCYQALAEHESRRRWFSTFASPPREDQ